MIEMYPKCRGFGGGAFQFCNFVVGALAQRARWRSLPEGLRAYGIRPLVDGVLGYCLQK